LANLNQLALLFCKVKKAAKKGVPITGTPKRGVVAKSQI